MKDINYPGNIAEDISLTKKKFNIFYNFLGLYAVSLNILCVLVFAIGAVLLGTNLPVFLSSNLSIIATVLTSTNILPSILITKKLKNNFNYKKEKAKNRLEEFAIALKNKENIDVSREALEEAQTKTTVTETKLYQNDNLNTIINKTINNFYFLDRNAQIQALKTIREAVTKKQRKRKSGKTEVTINYQLYEEQDKKGIEEHFTRTLSFKPKK